MSPRAAGPPTSTGEEVSGAKTALEKGLLILDFISIRGSATPAEISAGLDISRSATYRLVDRLLAADWLGSTADRGLRLGPRALLLGAAAVGQTDLLRIARPAIQELAQSAGDTVNLAVPDGDHMTYLLQEEGPQAIRVTARLGTRRPMNCSSLGKAYLASLTIDELDSMLSTMNFVRLTARSLMTPDELRDEVMLTRERGYSIDDVEVEEGVRCYGAAIRDFTGAAVAAISVAGPTDRIRSHEATLSAAVVATAARISRSLGDLT